MTIVVLSRYPDLFAGFVETITRWEPAVHKLLIRDGDLISTVPPLWDVITIPRPFNYARNVNVAWNETKPHDVILIGDDVRFLGTFVRQLRTVAYSDEKIGISCAQLWGQSPFVCGYFKREVIDAVGELDTRFTGYGREDMDWCRRMENLGYRTQPVEIPATHSGGTSYWRAQADGELNMIEASQRNDKLFEDKWK